MQSSLQDLTFFTFSYLKVNFNYRRNLNKAKEIFLKILDDETTNKMPLDIIEEAKKILMKDYKILIGINYYIVIFLLILVLLSLYKWAPIAEELKILR